MDQIERVRRFNRAVTQRVGALSDHYLARDRPLGEARVLWEIGEDGCEVRALRSRRALAPGHASGRGGALGAGGRVPAPAGAADGRVRMARLTPAGRAERALLDARSEELAAGLLEPLSPRRREQLV